MAASESRLFDQLQASNGFHSGQMVVRVIENPGACVDPVSRMSNTQKLRLAVWYALSSPDLSAEIKRALNELLSPENLAIAGGVLAAWVASHFFGVGEVVDVVLIGVAYFSLGMQAVQGLAELAEFGYDVVAARTDRDLRRAASKLVRAFALLGAEAALALLTRRAQLKLQRGKVSPTSGGQDSSSHATAQPPAKSANPSYQLGASDAGPGQWSVSPKRSKGAAYQQQVTGAAPGVEYAVPAETPSGKVLFDGYKDGKLLDAKDWSRWPPTDKKFWHQGVVDEATKQVEAANGTPIEWHFPVQEKADIVRELLKTHDIQGIEVVVTPKTP